MLYLTPVTIQVQKEDVKHDMLIEKDNTVLVVIDFQERTMRVMHDADSVTKEAAKLIKGFEILGQPVLITQQYTKGLGDSVQEIKEACAAFSHIEKDTFSAMRDENFADALKRAGMKNVVICGAESHVCVLQTALAILKAGYNVFVAVDSVASRKERDRDTAIKRMIQAGVTPVTVESVLFELLDNDAKSETFKAISRLIK